MHFVIIGGDAAGMSAASRAKRLDPNIDVTVLEQTADVSYSACNMPYNIADPHRDMGDLVVRQADVFRQKQGIDLLTDHRVTAIDTAGRTVSGLDQHRNSFELPFDRLLIATGASPIMPDLPGIDMTGVMALKQLRDGRIIKDYLKTHQVARVVILGMGYIALEMAEALRERDIEVTLIKPRPQVLPWLEPSLAETVVGTLENNGVQVHAGRAVEHIAPEAGALKVVAADRSLPAEMVLVAVGVAPNSDLASDAGLELGPARAIAVNRQMQTSASAVYAAGDCAASDNVVTGQRTWVPLALRANRTGWAVADHMAGRPVDLPGIAGTSVFKVFDLEVARTGLTASEAKGTGFAPETVTVTSESRSGLYPGARPIQVHMVADEKTGKMLGAQMVGQESAAHRINAAAVALHAGMTVAEFIQCDLAYAPPFGGVWDPLLVAANQLIKKL